MSTELAVIESQEIQAPESLSADVYLAPALSVEAAVERQMYLQKVVSRMLVPYTKDSKSFDGADYGVLPGTSTRTLFQPGAEKLAMFFGLQVDLSRQQATEDWDKGFFFYRYKAIVRYKGQEVCNIERSCHTREDKYAWVWVEAAKPSKDIEEQMKADKTGRNRQVTKWESGRSSKVWVWQERRPNPDTFSLQFVVEAMAQKRAYVAAVKKALGATGFFAKEVDAESFRDEMPTEPERPVRLVGGQPKPDKPAAKSKKPEPEVVDAEVVEAGPNSTDFWKRANAAGVKREDALPIANRADAGEITWAEAIESLP